MKHIEIVKEGLSLVLCPPDFNQGYYRGTRFDHSGIFRKIVLNGRVIADEWFDSYDPYRHDAVCGMSEEFTQSGFDDAKVGELFLKPGVGLLHKDDEADYDRFRLYRVADPGMREVNVGDGYVEFVHEINGSGWGYRYVKIVKILDGGTFEIRHSLQNTGEKRLKGQTYNHNFLTFDNVGTGTGVGIDFSFKPTGNWRSDYDSVALTESGICFSRDLNPGESVFMGDLKPVDGNRITGWVFNQKGAGSTFTYCSDQAFDFIVFWANHRVACLEPYVSYDIEPGEEFCWTYTYLVK